MYGDGICVEYTDKRKCGLYRGAGGHKRVPIVKFLLGVSNVSVPFDTLILSVVLFVVIPLAGGILPRVFVTCRKGAKYFENVFIHKFDSATTVGLLLTLVLIFMGQSEVILNNPLHIVLIAMPLILQTFLIFFIAYFACKLLKLPHDISAPASMIGASNFFELAVAVAVEIGKGLYHSYAMLPLVKEAEEGYRNFVRYISGK